MTQLPSNAVPASDVLTSLALADQAREDQEIARARELAPYGDGMRFTPEAMKAVELDLAHFVRVSVLMSAAAGRRLLWVRENLGDANLFDQWIRHKTGFSRRTAFKHMALARRLMDKRMAHFVELDLGQVRALTDLSDADLDRFAESGCLGDLTADDVSRLSVKELQDKVRFQNERIRDGASNEVRLEGRIQHLEQELGIAARKLSEQITLKVEASRIALHQLNLLLEKVDYDHPVESLEVIFGSRDQARETLGVIAPFCAKINSLFQSMLHEDIEYHTRLRAAEVRDDAPAPVAGGES